MASAMAPSNGKGGEKESVTRGETGTGPPNHEKKEPKPPTEEENKASKRIFKFWKKRKNLKKWWRTGEGLKNNQKKKFATGVVIVEALIVVVSILLQWFGGVDLGMFTGAFNLYLALLVWAATLPSNNPWQVKAGFLFIFLPFPSIFVVAGFGWLLGLVLAVVNGVLFYKLLKSMATTLQHTYAADIHGLSSRLSAKIIAGLSIYATLG